MIKTFIPDIKLGTVFEITPELLMKRNIKLLMLDLDNTIATYWEEKPTEEIKKWVASMTSSGISLFIVSNTKTHRAKKFSEILKIPYIDHAGKPFTKSVKRVMIQMGKRPEESALAGDQIFTDTLCAKRAGVFSIIVKPIELKNAVFLLRYAAEYIFRFFTPKSM